MKIEDIQENELFDSLVRGELGDASVEAPEGLWDAIAGELDTMCPPKPARVRRIVVWSSLSGAAAAATVVMAVLFGSRQNPVEIIPQTQSLAYSEDIPAEEILLPEDIVPQNVISFPSLVPPVDYEEVPASEETGPSALEDNADGNVPEETAEKPASRSNNLEADVKDIDEKWVDPFYEPQAQPRKPNISFIVFGDAAAAVSNNKSSSTKQRAPRANLPNVTTIQESSASTFALPLTFGFGVRIPFNDKWSLGTGLSYSYLSRTFDGRYIQVDDAGEITMIEDFTGIVNPQHYLGIPVYGYYNILDSNRFLFYAYAGGAIEKCLSNKYFMNGESGRYTHSSKTAGVQLSVAGGVGFEYDFTRLLGIYIDPSVRYYFNMDQPKSIRTQQPLNFGIELGLRFKL